MSLSKRYRANKTCIATRTQIVISCLLLGLLAVSATATHSNATTTISYVHTDHLGTPKLLTNENGEVTWSLDHQPFGDTIENLTGVSVNLRFSGQYFDQETGLHYNYYRDYDPAVGRFTQSDPLGLAGGIALYSYAVSNPLKFVDPYGLEVYPIPPPASSNDGTGRPSSIYFGGCFFSTCGESGGPQSGSIEGPNLIISFLPKIGGYVSVCSDPPPVRECTIEDEQAKQRREDNAHPIYGEDGSLTYSIGARELGLSYSNQGSLCFSIGGAFPPIPFNVTENRGPISDD